MVAQVPVRVLEPVAAPEDGTLTVSVGEAAAGSGESGVDPMAVTAGSPENELTFTYTAVGTIGYAREFRVTIAAGWSDPSEADDTDKGTYTVALADEDGRTRANVVEALDPVERDLVARVRAGSWRLQWMLAMFLPSHTRTPTRQGMLEPQYSRSCLLIQQVGDDLTVLVGSGKDATMLMVDVSARYDSGGGR